MPEPLPLGDPVDSDPTPFQPPHHDSVGRAQHRSKKNRHRDYSGGTDDLIRNNETNFTMKRINQTNSTN